MSRLATAQIKPVQFDQVVRHVFDIGHPRKIEYRYGWSESDLKFDECRDEQAWIIEAEYTDSKGKPEDVQLVTVRLRPGVSKREARKATDRAVEFFSKKAKPKRPGILPRERAFIDAVFTAITRKVSFPLAPHPTAEITELFLKANGIVRSLNTIRREYRRWRREKGFPVKRYLTEKR